jgi:hypothetical protein
MRSFLPGDVGEKRVETESARARGEKKKGKKETVSDTA